MTLVTSSQIESMGHDINTNKMRVQFKNGDIYEYDHVTRPTFDRILQSESVGKEFNTIIKKNPTSYPYSKVGAFTEPKYIYFEVVDDAICRRVLKEEYDNLSDQTRLRVVES